MRRSVGTDILYTKILNYPQMSVDKINLAPITNNSDVQLWYKYSSGGMLSGYEVLWQRTKGCHRIHAAIESAITILKIDNRSLETLSFVSRNYLLHTRRSLDQISYGSGLHKITLDVHDHDPSELEMISSTGTAPTTRGKR